MNHAGIGRLTTKGYIEIPVDLLHPLSITPGVMVWGMLYPPLPGHVLPNNYAIEYDLILSPIPFDLWGKTVRLQFHTIHSSSVFTEITSILKDEGASILLSEASRSAHRHDTWTMLINFMDLDVKLYDETNKLYTELIPRIESLRERLNQLDKKNQFYKEPSDEKLSKGFEIYPHRANSYFYNVFQRSLEFNSKIKQSSIDYITFKLICDSKNHLVPTGDKEICSVVDYLNDAQNEIAPSFLFAEMDTVDSNIRAAIISKNIQHKFFGFEVSISRYSDTPFTSAGIVDAILRSLPSTYKVWSLTTKLDLFSKIREEGRTSYLIYDESNQHINSEEREKFIKKTFEENKQLFPSNIKTDSVSIRTLEALRGQGASTKFSDEMKHIFISYSTENSKEANVIREKLNGYGIDTFLAEKKMQGGDIFDNSIKIALQEAYEVILLFSESSAKSDWVKKEAGAAWVLDRRIVPILFRIEISHLPEDLRKYHVHYYEEVLGDWSYPIQFLDRMKVIKPL